MLKFEFVQPGEFEDPRYEVIQNKIQTLGGIVFDGEHWTYDDYSYFYLDSGDMDEISAKLKQLNQSTKSQRILGVF